MKGYLATLLAALALLAITKADHMKLKEAVQKCKASENLESLDGIKNTNEATTEAEKCFIGCMLMDMKMLDKNGQYDVALAKETINNCPHLKDKPDEKNGGLEAAEQCGSAVSTCNGHCECGLQVINCLTSEMQSKGYEFPLSQMDELLKHLD